MNLNLVFFSCLVALLFLAAPVTPAHIQLQIDTQHTEQQQQQQPLLANDQQQQQQQPKPKPEPMLGYEPNLTGSAWESQAAADKDTQIDELIYSDNTSTTFYNPVSVAGILLESMNLTFDTVADDMPAQGWPVTLERPKLIHTVGAIAPASFTPVSETVAGLGYTGVFSSGCNQMYLRFSMAGPPTASPPNIVPGISLKFLRDGVPSGNMLSMYSLSGQTSFNFFEHDFSNHPPVPDPSNMTASQLELFQHFQTASNWPTMIGCSDLASYDAAGNPVDSPQFPYRLIFHPYTNVHQLFPDSPSSDEYFYLPQLESMAPGPVYYVYAETTPGGAIVHIGDLSITAPPSGSNYGDLNLFFQHTRMETDFAIHPEWVPLATAINLNQSSTPGYTYPDLPFN